jgi:hypothetical protein
MTPRQEVLQNRKHKPFLSKKKNENKKIKVQCNKDFKKRIGEPWTQKNRENPIKWPNTTIPLISRQPYRTWIKVWYGIVWYGRV